MQLWEMYNLKTQNKLKALNLNETSGFWSDSSSFQKKMDQ